MVSIFTSQVPANANADDGIAYTLGTLFVPAVNGQVTHGRWRFPTTLPTGTVQFGLFEYTNETTGTLLASKNFASPVAGAWNTIALDAPVDLVAGQHYIAAVYTTGRYVVTSNFFTGSSVVNGDLTAPADDAGTPRRNGKFHTAGTPLTYPEGSFNGGCYFADIVFVASSPDEEVTDTPGHLSLAGSPGLVLTDLVIPDSPGHLALAGSPGGVEVGWTIADTPGHLSLGGSPASVQVGEGAADVPGHLSFGGSPGEVTYDTLIADAAPGVALGGSPGAVLLDELMADGGSGLTLGGSPGTVLWDVVIPDSPGHLALAGSPGYTEAIPVLVAGAAGAGLALGGSPGTVTTAAFTVSDTSVLPVAEVALACLETALQAVAKPPAYFSLRPGIGFTAGLSQSEDECCQGSAWVRVSSVVPTDNFPNPASGLTPCWPDSYAVELEFGVVRCAPTHAPGAPKKIVTSAQWSALTAEVLADRSAMVRAACCLRDAGYDVILGRWSPLDIEGGCTGGTVTVTVRANACDC